MVQLIWKDVLDIVGYILFFIDMFEGWFECVLQFEGWFVDGKKFIDWDVFWLVGYWDVVEYWVCKLLSQYVVKFFKDQRSF